MDSLFFATEDISNIFSDSIIYNTLASWKNNLIIIDFKENFYNKTFQNRENFGKIIKISEEDLYYNPFWFIKNAGYGLFKKEDLKKYKEIVTEMYEIAEKYFFMDTRYKAYSINLMVAVIYHLIKINEKISIDRLIDFFSSSKAPLDCLLSDILKKELEMELNTEILRPFIDCFELSEKRRNDIFISINNILEVFGFKGLTEYDNSLNIKKLFANEEYTLYISLSSLENKISKGKVKFLINQILKNRERLKNRTLVILPDFKILNEIPELKEMMFYDEKNGKIKLLLASNILNLLKLEKNILEKRRIVLDSESIKKLKYFKKFPIKKKLEQHELLYINKSVLKKINKINCKYDEKYVIKQCLKYIIIILLICLYSDFKFNL